MKLQRLLSYVRRATDDYKMIRENDKIAVGLSGGKDSTALLIALANMRRFYPIKYELCAITVSLGFEGIDLSSMYSLCESLNVEYKVVETDIGTIIFDERKEKNPCSLCSKMRKGALHEEAVRLGCNVIALGHSKDDVIETFFMSLFYEGRIHTFMPVTFLDRSGLYSIRPLIYAPEGEIISFGKGNDLPIIHNPCPANGNTARQDIKNYIKENVCGLNYSKDKIFRALQNSDINGWNTQYDYRGKK